MINTKNRVELNPASIFLWRDISAAITENKTVVLAFEKTYRNLVSNDIKGFIELGLVNEAVFRKQTWFRKLKYLFFISVSSSAIQTLVDCDYILVKEEPLLNELRLIFEKP